MKKEYRKEYPGDNNEVSKRAKPMKIPLTMDPKYRNIGASTNVGDVKADIIDSATGKFYGSKAITNKVVEGQKVKLLKQINDLTESVIWEHDKEDPENPEVLVKGVGRYKLKSLKQNVRSKLKDLYEEISKADDRDAWEKAAWKLKHAAMHEMVKTIVAAEQELHPEKKD